MLFLLITTIFAQEENLYSWISQGITEDNTIDLLRTPLPPTISRHVWNQSSPNAFSTLFFAEPSPLALLNQYQITHALLPSTLVEKQYTMAMLKTDTSSARLLYISDQLQAIFLSYEPSALHISANPFQENRFVSLYQEINELMSTCQSRNIIDQDRYANPLAWQGENCALGNLIVTYRPAESYPLQAIFYAQN